ncbi:hypothetical protein Q3V94_02210 [Caloramator sp. CAR-1]|uniref:hypothetical protein n=1 Tax=Caloramator sp. CAR-1 TaxID=3062777 RepID=UPI0026E26E74|nr:hypothetical protein [Caloramator sp. CAR-1]MDO6353898.1 hypothetical protein [Caloramator sp. CAR-1]
MEKNVTAILSSVIAFFLGLSISALGTKLHTNDVIMGALTSIIFGINLLIAVVVSCTIYIIYEIKNKK